MQEILVDRRRHRAWLVKGTEKMELENVRGITINHDPAGLLDEIRFSWSLGQIKTRNFRFTEDEAGGAAGA